MTNKIFISIANYRDPQTQDTVSSILDSAKYPDDISIGILNQVNIPGELKYVPKFTKHIRQETISYKASKGVCWARNYIINNLLRDEQYLLQIDSHSRFVKDWDEVLLNQYLSLQDPKAIITHYPNSFIPPDTFSPLLFSRLGLKGFDDNQIPQQQPIPNIVDKYDKPVKGAFFAGGCAFGESNIFRAVPYDPYLYFTGEEITMAVRLYTHGYNLYYPSESFMWHYYNNNNVRPTHWQDHKDWFKLESMARSRIKQLLGIENTRNINDMVDFHKYALGTNRSLSSYCYYAGVNFKDQTLNDRAKTGIIE